MANAVLTAVLLLISVTIVSSDEYKDMIDNIEE